MVENISENTKDIYNMHFGAEAFGFENAGKLRKYQTESESILWEDLKNKKLDGFKFRRQHPVSRFVVDFYCHRVKLVIEIDGGIHSNSEVKENDMNRQKELEDFGLTIIRFTNNDVLLKKDEVLQTILKTIHLLMKTENAEGK